MRKIKTGLMKDCKKMCSAFLFISNLEILFFAADFSGRSVKM